MLDFKSFKKIHDDGSKAILQHEDGHQIHIAKSALSQSLHKQLDKLPLHQFEGSTAEDISKGFNDAMGIGGKPPMPKPKPKPTAMAEGGEATPEEEDSSPLPEADNAAVRGMAATGAAPDLTAREEVPVGQPVEGGLLQSQLDQTKAPETPAGLTTEQHQALDQAMAQGQKPEDALKSILGYSEQAGALKGMGEASQSGANAQAKIAGQAASSQHEALNQAQQHLQTMDDTISHMIQDTRDNHIKPNDYLDSLSSGQKVTTAIGLILGGIGGGLTGQENPALKFLNSQIERNLNAQKADMENKHNVLSALQHQFGNKQVAENMFRVWNAGVFSDQMQQQALKSQGQQAKYAAQLSAGKLMQGYLPLLQQNTALMMAQGQPGQGGQPAQTDPASLVRFLVPKEHQDKVAKEIKDAQTATEVQGKLNGEFQKAIKEVQPFQGGNVLYSTGLMKAPNIKALELLMDPVAHDEIGRVNPIIQQHIKENLPQLGDKQSTLDTKLAALNQLVQTKRAAPLAKSFGIDMQKFQSTAAPAEKPEIQVKDGVRYQKVQGGWQKIQ